MDQNKEVIVIGGGIAGLTASALLAHEGLSVTLFESHYQAGGCAGTFKRGNYIFDVGATQVAGLEIGGIHERIFRYLGISQPLAKVLELGCLVDLCDGYKPIHLWHDPLKWKQERESQFPGSEKFWTLCSLLHKSNWSIAQKDPVIPIRSLWDLSQFLNSFGLDNLPFCNCFAGIAAIFLY